MLNRRMPSRRTSRSSPGKKSMKNWSRFDGNRGGRAFFSGALTLRDAESVASGAVSDKTAHLSSIGAHRARACSRAQITAPDRKLHPAADDSRVSFAHHPTARKQKDLHVATVMNKLDIHAFSIDPVAGEVRYSPATQHSLQSESLFQQINQTLDILLPLTATDINPLPKEEFISPLRQCRGDGAPICR